MSVLQPIKTIGEKQASLMRLVLFFASGLAVGGLAGFFLGRMNAVEVQPPAPAVLPTPVSEETPSGATTPASDHPAPAVAMTEPSTSKQAPLLPDGMQSLALSVTTSLYATLAKEIDGREADVLNAQLGRVLVWWFDLRRDVLNEDRLTLLYKPVDNPSENQVIALRYFSQKLNRSFSAYLFRCTGCRYSRFYDQEGQEIERRLANPPVAEYEQVTELMQLAGRRHRGVDFKTDIGTEVVAPFRSKVTRANWRSRGNGNCLELYYLDTGITALFLHLSDVLPSSKPGTIVAAGTVVARTGNTGHSTAPHLHYQLRNGSGKLLNPYDIHETERIKLSAEDLKKFKESRDRLDEILLRAEPVRESSEVPSASTPSPAKPG